MAWRLTVEERPDAVVHFQRHLFFELADGTRSEWTGSAWRLVSHPLWSTAGTISAKILARSLEPSGGVRA